MATPKVDELIKSLGPLRGHVTRKVTEVMDYVKNVADGALATTEQANELMAQLNNRLEKLELASEAVYNKTWDDKYITALDQASAAVSKARADLAHALSHQLKRDKKDQTAKPDKALQPQQLTLETTPAEYTVWRQ